MESKRNKTFGSVIFGTNVIQRTWSASQEAAEAATRVEGAPTPPGRAPYLVGPSGGHRRTSSSYISLHTSKISKDPPKKYFHHRNLLYPRDPILEPSRRSAGGGIDHGGLLYQHHSLSDEV